jgi:hypothetical protein
VGRLVIACATVIEEILPILPSDVGHRVLQFGLHREPEKLRLALQDAINEVSEGVDTIILGYGLCARGVVGLRSDRCTLIVPKVDDCISIFLGSAAAYQELSHSNPGTYYLTKGWIEAGDSPIPEEEQIIARLGKERAERMFRLMLKNYSRLAFINTGQYEVAHYRSHARETADKLGLRFEEIEGSAALVKKMIHGPWDDDFIVVQPGEAIQFSHFFPDGEN